MIVDCSGFCGGYSRNGGDTICWEGYSVSEDHKGETQRLTDKRMAPFAALQVQGLAKTILRGEEPVEEWTDAQGNAAFPTPQEFLEGILIEIVGRLKYQRRHGFHEQQQELFKIMASVVRRGHWRKGDRRKLAQINRSRERWKRTLKRQSKKRHRNRPSRCRRSSRWQRSRWPSCRHRKQLAEMSTRG